MGGPYPLQVWLLGAHPSVKIDIPISAVFIVLFLACAATHIIRFRKNLTRGNRFLLSPLLIGYSMSRMVACVLRICTTALPRNTKIFLAYNVFLNIGAPFMFILHLALARRLMRAKFPNYGFHPATTALFWGLCTLCVLAITMILTVVIQSFLTLSARIHHIDRQVQLAVLTIFAVVSCLPLPIAIISFFKTDVHMGWFAYDRSIARASLLFVATFIVCFDSIYRCCVTWQDPVPLIHPKPKYMHTACFYAVYFASDFIVIAMHALARVDRLFLQSEDSTDYPRDDEFEFTRR